MGRCDLSRTTGVILRGIQRCSCIRSNVVRRFDERVKEETDHGLLFMRTKLPFNKQKSNGRTMANRFDHVSPM